MKSLNRQELLDRLLADNPRIKKRSELAIDKRKSNHARRERLELEKELRDIMSGEYPIHGIDLTKEMGTLR